MTSPFSPVRYAYRVTDREPVPAPVGDDGRSRKGGGPLHDIGADGTVSPMYRLRDGTRMRGHAQAPAAGTLVAEIVVDGEASLLDVSSLSARRFERGNLLSDAHGELYS